MNDKLEESVRAAIQEEMARQGVKQKDLKGTVMMMEGEDLVRMITNLAHQFLFKGMELERKKGECLLARIVKTDDIWRN